MAGKKKKTADNVIAVNRRALHDYFIEDRFEAGLSLQGWEVKSLRAGKANISEAYVTPKNGEMLLLGATITPLKHSCAFVVSDPQRTRRLLLNKSEINKLRKARGLNWRLPLHAASRSMTSATASRPRNGSALKSAL